jgi:protein-disulfide isomerase
LLALVVIALAYSDLEFAVDPESDHIRGPLDARVPVVEYGDFECPYGGARCARAAPRLRGRPLRVAAPAARRRHPYAELAALASEAAADQGAFWEMQDQLLEHHDKLGMADLVSYADRSDRPVRGGRGLTGVSSTPTFFIDGRCHHGACDIDTLSRAVRAAGRRAKLAAS